MSGPLDPLDAEVRAQLFQALVVGGLLAGVELGLALLLRTGDVFHGMSGFGQSAPWSVLGEHFGFTAEAVTERARSLLR